MFLRLEAFGRYLRVEFEKIPPPPPSDQEHPPYTEYVPTPMSLHAPRYVGFVSTNPDHSYTD